MRIEPLARPSRRMRLAPLVDVVFLLLVFFMLVARLETPRAITVEPPQATGAGMLAGSVLLRIDQDGRLDFNGLEVAVDRLPEEIAPYLEREPQPRFLVQPAYDAPLQALVSVLDALKGSGAEDLTLIDP